MPERRRSGRDLRDALIAAVEQFHSSTGAWPTPHQLATTLNRSVNNLRWHIDKLIVSGVVLREGGTLHLVGHQPTTSTAPDCLSSDDMDQLIIEAARDWQRRSSEALRVGHVVGFIIDRRAPVIHARMDALVASGRLTWDGSGYRLPE